MTEQILVSFNHNVAAVIDGRILGIWCAVCEEVFHGKVSVETKEKGPTQAEAMNQAAQSMSLDFPIMLRVLSLGDGKPLTVPVEIMVKWSNISAMCNFDNSWIRPKADSAQSATPTTSKKKRG